MVIPHPIKLPPSMIYLEELQTINHLLLEKSDKVTYSITGTHENYAYESLNDMLTEHQQRPIREMSIRSKYVRIDISSSQIKIHYDSDDISIYGIVERLRHLFTARTSLFQKWRYSMLYISFLTLPTAFLMIYMLFPRQDDLFKNTYSIIAGISAVPWVSIFLNQTVSFKTVHLTERKKRRFTDRLLEKPSELIGPILGAILGAVLAHWLTCNK